MNPELRRLKRLRVGNAGGGAPIRFNLSDEEKSAVVAFLKTLSDPFLLNDVRFSDLFIAAAASFDVFALQLDPFENQDLAGSGSAPAEVLREREQQLTQNRQ